MGLFSFCLSKIQFELNGGIYIIYYNNIIINFIVKENVCEIEGLRGKEQKTAHPFLR